jgi:hypothetical protein
MKVAKTTKTIALSGFVLATVVGGALAQERVVSRLYGAESRTIRRIDAQLSTDARRQAKSERRAGDLNASQWVEVAQAAEGLLGLHARKAAAQTLAMAVPN